VDDTSAVIEVRRVGDDELCGFVIAHGERWHSLSVFGGLLGDHDAREAAARHVLESGLASLADRWVLVDHTSGDEQIVCIQEASPERVTLALGYYSLPGVPSFTLTRRDLLDGRWQLRHG
jgi:hypothetical protein